MRQFSINTSISVSHVCHVIKPLAHTFLPVAPIDLFDHTLYINDYLYLTDTNMNIATKQDPQILLTAMS